ncbi:polysaccharide deacetylase family protein [Altererythrobacter sp. MTPC7]|uniref:polysaccharide deacetylase family protein n=1 Tax=Altererythrobacter sp. MTPC7 TaxID=3056567 RepID=UPI0036F43DA9
MLDPPPAAGMARFANGFGRRVLLTVDTEEEFDWGKPFSATEHGLEHVRHLRSFQEFSENLGVSPVYLVDWPIAHSPMAREVLGDAARRGKAEIGIQLHPWVNPPHDEEVNQHNSYAGNLSPQLERRKFIRLREAIEQNFGVTPLVYRAGRYGLGPQTAALLAEQGVAVDTSVRSNFDYRADGGADYSRHPLRPYWIGGDRRILELPLTTVYWGLLRKQGAMLEPLLGSIPFLGGMASRLGLLEKIPLTPEGVSTEEALRGIDMALDDDLPLLVLSFHSPSLAPGHTPYVTSERSVDSLYDWFREVYAYLGQRGVQNTTVAEIMEMVSLENAHDA